MTVKCKSPLQRTVNKNQRSTIHSCLLPFIRPGPLSDIIQEHSIEIRVRYSETDAMGLLHHSNYLTYFEVGRTELFRTQGGNYRKMEELGLFFVVARIDVRFKSPARYDEVLKVQTSITRQTPAKLEHHYELSRGNMLLCQADSVIACVNADGIVQRIPEDIIQKTSDG